MEEQKVVFPTEQGQLSPLANGIDSEEETSRIMSAELGVTKFVSRRWSAILCHSRNDLTLGLCSFTWTLLILLIKQDPWEE